MAAEEDNRRWVLNERVALLSLAIVCVMAPALIAPLVYDRSLAHHEAQIRDSLLAVSEDRAAHVGRWLEEKRDDALAVSCSPFMARAVTQLLEDRSTRRDRQMQARLGAEMQSRGFLEILLLDTSGGVIVGARGSEEPPDAAETAIVRSSARRGVVLHDAHGEGEQLPHLDLAIPIPGVDGDHEAVAVVLERISIESEFLRDIHADPVPGAVTASALLESATATAAILSSSPARTASLISTLAVGRTLRSGPGPESGSFDPEDPMTLVTRVPGSEWVLVTSADASRARADALADVLLAIGFPAAALAVIGVAMYPVRMSRRSAQRVRALAAVQGRRELDERLRFLLRESGAVFFVLDEALRIRYCDTRSIDLYGLSPSDLLGQPLAAITAEERASRDAARIRALSSGEETFFDSVHERSDGTSLVVRCRAGLGESGGEQAYQLLVSRPPAADATLAKLDGYQEKLRALAFELARTEERERRRLATNLHDRIGQTLTLLRMQLGALREAVPNGDAEELVGAADESVERAIEETRTLTCEISPPVLYDLGLVPALRWLAEQTADRFGLEVVVEHDESPTPAARDVRAALFAAVQELLMNVVKHSRAASAVVSIRSDDDRVHVIVRDDGIGFDPDTLTQARCSRGSFGLFSIGERLELLGGSLSIRSKPGFGTVVRLETPLWRGEGRDED